VPVKAKIAAFALGLGAVFVLEILELPLQYRAVVAASRCRRCRRFRH
jgi:hypothetical protein